MRDKFTIQINFNKQKFTPQSVIDYLRSSAQERIDVISNGINETNEKKLKEKILLIEEIKENTVMEIYSIIGMSNCTFDFELDKKTQIGKDLAQKTLDYNDRLEEIMYDDNTILDSDFIELMAGLKDEDF